MADTNDDQPITRSVLREELSAFSQNLTPAFHAVEEHIEATETKLLTEIHRLDTKIDDVEARLSTKIDGAEARLTQRIETAAVSFRKLEADVASLTRRMEDVERKLNPSQ